VIYNFRPVQTSPIPWGWASRDVGYGPTVVKPTGDIRALELKRYFSEEDFVIQPLPHLDNCGFSGVVSTDLKSLFTTTCRFLGIEETLVGLQEDREDITVVENMFLDWNIWLLNHFGRYIDYLFVGDDWAGNNGMLFSKSIWVKRILPYLIRLDSQLSYRQKLMVHSDGDIREVVDPILDSLEPKVIHFQRVGAMKCFQDGTWRKKTKFVENKIPMEYKGMAVTTCE
jgi:hypothetical protein